MTIVKLKFKKSQGQSLWLQKVVEPFTLKVKSACVVSKNNVLTFKSVDQTLVCDYCDRY